MKSSKIHSSPFQMEWRKCLVEHFRYLVDEEDYDTILSFYAVLAQYKLRKVITVANTQYTVKQLKTGVISRESEQERHSEEVKEAKKIKAREKSRARSATKKRQRAEAEQEGKPKQVWLFND